MLLTNTTLAQWHSSQYLTGLCHKSVCFTLPENQQLQLVAADESDSAHLVIFAEGLNLEKLYAIKTALSNVLSIDYFKSGRDMGAGCAVEAKVAMDQHSDGDLNTLIEQLSVATQTDMALLTHRPTLSQPGVLLMDMDSTVIGIECIDEIAKLAGVGEQVSAVTELAMQGKLDFVDSLTSRVACLADAPESILQQVRDAMPINPGISRLLHELRLANWKLAIASGGFTFFADYLLERLDLDYVIANQLEIKDKRLTGKVEGDIVSAQTKADTLTKLANQYGIDLSQTIALGDGANDLVMMKQAGLGIALHAKPLVRQQADAALRFSAADGLLAYLRQ
ncbi:phosphoserine phosphatase SerB [Aliiglaciecola litoralis]|uniref:Phosphoserine phosphatase n=1 Tax=Aliiglaciecola litoralis TaxID=582857 RepID=A0ABN1LKU5_9ALTE